jgi:hypothetical protein
VEEKPSIKKWRVFFWHHFGCLSIFEVLQEGFEELKKYLFKKVTKWSKVN